MEMIKPGMVGVYAIINNVNNKIYIGSSNDMHKRFQIHIGTLNRNIHPNSHLQRAWNKYGKVNFTFKLLEICTIENQIEIEQKYIDIYSKTHKLYNMAPVAGTVLGIKRSEEVKRQRSESTKGRQFRGIGFKHSEETIEKIREANTGYRHSEVAKSLNRQAHLGKTLSEETKQKIAAFQKTQTRSEETRKRMSDSKLGTIVSQETREKLRQVNLGKSMSEENKKALQKANIGNKYNLGRKQTEEEKKKRSESAKLFHQNKKKEKEISLNMDSIMIPSCELIGYNLNNMTHNNPQVRS